MKQKLLALISGIMLAMGGMAPAEAAFIKYEARGAATGFIDGVGAYSGPFSVVAIADTTTKQACLGGVPNCSVVINNSLQINIQDVGSFFVTSPTFSSLNTGVGQFAFGHIPSLSPFIIRGIMAVNVSPTGAPDPNFATWDLISNFNSITSSFVNPTTIPSLVPPTVPIPTNVGNLFVTQSTFFTEAFSASLVLTPEVPEPATWMMMILGFGFIGAAARRTQKLRVSFS